MKKIITFLLLALTVAISARCQDYDLRMAGQGDGGKYYVKITTVLDKKQNKTALDFVKRLTVDGVMFRGVASAKGYPSQSPLIKDTSVKARKSEFFDAFWNEQQYLNFVNLENESVVVTKLPKKKFEVTARLLVDKEALLQFLEDSGIVEGFGNLW